MSDSGKAVFLSYASQDAEAAKRICDVLRAAGVEVWFDQSELVGGDQWDTKIRGQIGSCALFVPIISANTQARREGYFRIEWKLAAQRTHAMADGTPFLLPLLIDGTRDAEALVPAEFKSVQWTKLPGGDVPPAFVARVKKMLSGEHEIGADSGQRTQNLKPRTENRRLGRLWWALPIFGVTMAMVLVMKESRKEPLPATPAPAAAAPSEARALVAKAWEQLNRPDMERPELQTADELCRKATSLDQTEASAWAAWSYVDSWYCYHALDDTPERREGARAKAARALQLAPTSFDARLAQANYLVREGSDAALSLYAPEADRLLRALLQERPAEPRALLAFAILQRNLGHAPEARLALETMAKDPAFAALAWHENAWVERRLGSPTVALDLEERSTAIKAFSKNLTTKIDLLMNWQGDLDAAQAVLSQLPATAMQEDYTATVALRLFHYRREPAALLRLANSIPRDWLQSNMFAGPLGWWKGLAEDQAGHAAAARVHWQAALQLVQRRQADAPSSPTLIAWQGRLQAVLGARAEAEKNLHLAWEMGGIKDRFYRWTDQLLIGELDQVIDDFEQIRQKYPGKLWAASFRLDPSLDPLRSNARFQALQAGLDADPRSNPKATAVPAPSSLLPARPEPAEWAPSARTEAEPKSVAVLAFANLSDDKANEYFSDGISEELLNVLAKVPGLKVTARTSSFYFKGKEVPIPEIARQLGVAYIVEGSVRKSGDKVRITAQLIKATDGFQVWSDTFTREFKDVFAVQDEIAGLVSQNLQVKMAMAPRRVDVSPEAYNLLLQARYYARQENGEGRKQAIEFYRRAVATEPSYALAWGEMARVYAMLGRYGGLPMREALDAARPAAQRALELNPDEPYGLNALGWVQRFSDWDWPGARKSFLRAVELAPDDATILSDGAILLCNTGRTKEAIALARRAVERDPLSARALFSLGEILEVASPNPEKESVEILSRGIKLAPETEAYRATRAILLARLARYPEAEESAAQEPNEGYRLAAQALVAQAAGDRMRSAKVRDELIAKYGDRMAGFISLLFAYQGENDQAFLWLDRATQQRDRYIPWFKNHFGLGNLHADPRWPVFLAKLGLTDEQLK